MADDSNNDPEPIEVDLEAVIGRVLDDRGLTQENVSKLSVLDDLPNEITNLFAANKPKPGKNFDQEGFTNSISELIDEKLKGIGSATESKNRGPGPLGRFLFGNSS